ncbi:glycoside hydrolase family 3 C-terminal domain-containing protein [Halogeometricum sp. S1BR25-6]|uniref:Glycoside hydrolase family 3 C-terminal domain-containing protein n=1 Tax=Halogeometricum salsisoli TaxID=2950536 RepID=A0ABU2GJW6_9EURY|nr:glycoside hydrolase family 3 C-terminal domain-containing protein [Halogeometricum sp. S1BR25-6]MDS0300711.1 glycoside hydrolase family 3 C-terminal domain-containing protein [Halogeometricum sp. S1BR25-6]
MTDNPDDGGEPDDRGGLGASRRTFLRATGGLALSGAFLGSAGSVAGDEETEAELEELVAEMTLEEKVSRTHGADGGPEGVAGYLTGVERLDVPGMVMADGPPGASLGTPTTDFPHPVAAAATFDPELISREGRAIAREAKTEDVAVLLAPSLDLFRVPTHARGGETYGEDPFLAGEMAREYASAVQSEGVVATLKHFVAYNQASTTGNVLDYFSYSEHNVIVDERPLREIYCRPFREAIVEGGAGAVMPAYTRINGTFCSEHDYLLEEVLKEEWGFDGFVVSDWGGTHSTVDAAVSGLDIEMPSAQYFGEALAEAVENDDLWVGNVDEQVRRGLRSQYEIGALDGDRKGSDPVRGTDEHFALARRMAEEGSVLLKNEDDLLPLDEDVTDVALVGPSPTEFKNDVGGSDAVTGIRYVSPADGIEAAGGDGVSVTAVATDRYEPAGPTDFTPAGGDGGEVAATETEVQTASTDETEIGTETESGDASESDNGTENGNGFVAEYYANGAWEGSPELVRREKSVDLTEADLERFADADAVSVRWRATYTAPETGTFAFLLTSQGASTLSVDGETVVDNEGGGFAGPKGEEATLEFEEGETYTVSVEAAGAVPVSLEVNPPSSLDEAVSAAAEADVALVLARTDTFYGDDRHEFELPGNQNALIEQVAAANGNAAVLLNTETPVAMPWLDDVPAVMQVWFPGQEGGAALGSLLFGDISPSGKTPVTFAESMDDYLPGEVTTLPDDGRAYPGVRGNVFYDEGVFVGYRHFDEADIEPLFPFGHGLSYAAFDYGEITLSRSETTPDEGLTVSLDVTNESETTGREAVQLYVSEVDPAVERPPKELKGVAKVEIPAGESRTVEIELGRGAFEYWDPETEDWTVNPGEFEILAGSSSRDIRHSASVSVVERE